MSHFKNKIKLIIITPSLKIGGSQRVIMYLCKYLDAKKFDITLLIINNQNKDSSFSVQPLKNIKIIDLKKTRVRNAILNIVKVIKVVKPDVVLSTQYHLNTAMLFVKLFIPSSIKMIARETNIPSKRLESNKLLQNIIYRKFYKNFNSVICQSECMKNDLIKTFKIRKDKLVIINNPIDCNAIINKEKSEENSFYKSDILAIASTLGHIKGLERLIDSIALMNIKNIKLIILGDGNSKNMLNEKIKKLKLHNQINLVGLQKDPVKFMQNTKVLAISSYAEGFPNTMLEAGLCGIPTVSFNIEGVKDILIEGMNGFLVPDGSLKEFAESLLKAIDYPFNKMQIQNHIRNNYNIEKIIKKYENLFIDSYNNKGC